MKNNMNQNSIRIASLVCVLLLLTTTLAWSAPSRAGDSSSRFGGEHKDYRGAIEKTGFYAGVVKDRVKLIDEKSYRELSYSPSSNMKVTWQGQEIELGDLLPHSIVTLIIVNAEVVEIVLLQESS